MAPEGEFEARTHASDGRSQGIHRRDGSKRCCRGADFLRRMRRRHADARAALRRTVNDDEDRRGPARLATPDIVFSSCLPMFAPPAPGNTTRARGGSSYFCCRSSARAAAPSLWPPSAQDCSRRTPSIEVLEATSGCKVTRTRKRAPPTDATEEGPTDALMARLVALPPPLVGKVASYWRTARDPLYRITPWAHNVNAVYQDALPSSPLHPRATPRRRRAASRRSPAPGPMAGAQRGGRLGDVGQPVDYIRSAAGAGARASAIDGPSTFHTSP